MRVTRGQRVVSCHVCEVSVELNSRVIVCFRVVRDLKVADVIVEMPASQSMEITLHHATRALQFYDGTKLANSDESTSVYSVYAAMLYILPILASS